MTDEVERGPDAASRELTLREVVDRFGGQRAQADLEDVAALVERARSLCDIVAKGNNAALNIGLTGMRVALSKFPEPEAATDDD